MKSGHTPIPNTNAEVCRPSTKKHYKKPLRYYISSYFALNPKDQLASHPF